jgi:hypothetical protein
MKLKFLYSALIIAIFGILGGASVDENGSISHWVWITIAILVIGGIGMVLLSSSWEKQAEEEAEKKRQMNLAYQAEVARIYKSWLNDYTERNGVPDKIINIKNNNTKQIIIAHESSKRVYILGQFYDFKDILNCNFSDSPRIIKGAVKTVTKSNTGSTVGRAIVGDVIAGPAGAIIGGTTGKKTTEFQQENDRTIHDYTVIININSLTSPILRIHTGEDGKLANEIVGLMNVIIARK